MAQNPVLKVLARKYPHLKPVIGWISGASLIVGAIATFLGHIEKVKQLLFEWIGPARLQSLHVGMEVLVWLLFTIGYACAGIWLYRRYVSPARLPMRKAVGTTTLLVGFFVLTLFTVRSVIPSPPDLAALLHAESTRWRKDLLGLQNADGGLRYHKTDAVDSQAWNSAQIVVGILAGDTRLSEDEAATMRNIFKFFESTRLADSVDRGEMCAPSRSENEGWGYFEYVPWGVSEINAWIALAYIYSQRPPNRQLIWGSAEQEGAEQMATVLNLITKRQLPDGGWAPINDTTDPRFGRTYSSVMSLWALIEAKQLMKSKEFDDRIKRGITWLLARYDASAGGWVPNPDRKKQLDSFPGLTAQVLYVLTLARDDFDNLLSGGDYEAAIGSFAGWLNGDTPPHQKQSLLSRPISNNDRAHDSDRYLPRSKFMIESSTFLWYPWTVSLCTTLQSTDPKKWEQCALIYDRVHELVKFVKDEQFAYATAEGLYAVNLLVPKDISKKNASSP